MKPPPENTRHPPLWEPPGGLLIWMLVILELVTFGAGILAFVHQGRGHAEEFHQARLLLNQPLAFANTLVLLTGGWLMSCGLGLMKRGKNTAASRLTLAAAVTGVSFLVLKLFEYRQKALHGVRFGTDTFFTLYYLLTGFHFVHVLVAVVLLVVLARSVRRSGGPEKLENLEAGGVFWHMCDLVWLLLYPAVYLL